MPAPVIATAAGAEAASIFTSFLAPTGVEAASAALPSVMIAPEAMAAGEVGAAGVESLAALWPYSSYAAGVGGEIVAAEGAAAGGAAAGGAGVAAMGGAALAGAAIGGGIGYGISRMADASDGGLLDQIFTGLGYKSEYGEKRDGFDIAAQLGRGAHDATGSDLAGALTSGFLGIPLGLAGAAEYFMTGGLAQDASEWLDPQLAPTPESSIREELPSPTVSFPQNDAQAIPEVAAAAPAGKKHSFLDTLIGLYGDPDKAGPDPVADDAGSDFIFGL